MTLIQKTNVFFWITGVLIMILCPIGVAVGTWIGFGPETFWQRMAAVVIGVMFLLFSLVPCGFLMYFLNEWFDRWLLSRRDERERKKRQEQVEYERRNCDARNQK